MIQNFLLTVIGYNHGFNFKIVMRNSHAVIPGFLLYEAYS